jgi:hypothetical protein
MGRDVVKWLGAVLAVVGTAAFAYGLVVLISNGNCGCGDDGFCGPACPPADDLGFAGLFAGIWVAVIGIIMMSAAASRAKLAKWRAQYGSGLAAYTGSRLATPGGTPAAGGLTFASMGGSFGATPGMTMAPGMNPSMFDPKAMTELAAQLHAAREANGGNADAARQATLDVLRSHGYQIPANVPPGPVVLQVGASPAVVSSGPGFALPGAQGPAPGSAEAILAADAQAGVPATPPAQGDATGRLQELDALKASGVVNDAEYAAQRQRILDSI